VATVVAVLVEELLLLLKAAAAMLEWHFQSRRVPAVFASVPLLPAAAAAAA
jgi:hypothetical protein